MKFAYFAPSVDGPWTNLIAQHCSVPAKAALAVLLASCLSGLSFASVCFSPAVTYSVASPSSVAIGDFSSDGIPDLAVVNNTFDGGISILLGNGDGTFRTPINFPVGRHYPLAVATADLNHDGRLDLAVVNPQYDNVSVFLGNGDGTFRAGGAFATGSTPVAVVIGDFNGDGNLDLAVADYFGKSQVSVLLGNGDGSFQTAVNYFVGLGDPSNLAIGDLNGDGAPDLALASNNSKKVSILLGNGDGSFQDRRGFRAGPDPFSVAIGDFNRDGKLDLATADISVLADYGVAVLLGNGDGTFGPLARFRSGPVCCPAFIAVADFDADGNSDLAVANGNIAEGLVSVLLGNGDGTFKPPVTFRSGIQTIFLAAQDLNDDSAPDIVAANYASNSISVFLNLGKNCPSTIRFRW